MKRLTQTLLVALALLPAGSILTKSVDPTLRINAVLVEAAANHDTYAFVDFSDQTWSEEKQFKAAFEKLGYHVDFTQGLGFGGVNSALQVKL